MKHFLLANLICLLLPMLGSSQVLRIITSPTQISSQVPAYTQVTSITSKTISYTPSNPPIPPTPIDEDSTAEESKVYKYADVLSVNIGIADGNITSVSSGKVWTLKINVPNASNIGLIFNQINLSPSAELYIFNESKTILDSGIKKSHFTYTTEVGIFPFAGNSITLYIYEPNNFGTFQSSIYIQKLEAGYQPVEDVGDYSSSIMSSAQRSIGCIPHVVCDPSKMQSARAVARFVYNGVLGTGTLINNEQNNGRAFFLTGFHVVDKDNNNAIDAAEITALQSARFEFSFWNTSCSGSGTVNHALSFSGAVLRAHNRGTDMVLLELLNPPGVGDGVNYAGWSRSTSAPTGNASYIIHHADGKSMRLTKTSNVKNWFWNNNYWTAHYNSGVVVPGSSGSALFNQNGSIVGTLRSGWSSCTLTDFGDRYGKFNVSWTAGGLQTWLSPANNHQAANTLVLAPVAISGPAVVPCDGTSVTYSIPNLLGCTYAWSVPNTLNIVSGQGTSSIVVAKNGTPTSQPSGIITLTVTDSKGRSRMATVNKTITISFPDVDQLQLVKSGPTCLSSPYQAISLGASYNNNTGCDLKYNSGITEVEWQITSPFPYLLTNNAGVFSCNPSSVVNKAGVSIGFASPPSGSYVVTIRLRVKNQCGLWSEWTPGNYHVVQNCSWFFTVSPNPSSSQIDVTIDNSNAAVEKGKPGNATNFIREIQIADKSGNILRKQRYDGQQSRALLNISNLQPDVYFIRVFNGNEWKTQTIIKK